MSTGIRVSGYLQGVVLRAGPNVPVFHLGNCSLKEESYSVCIMLSYLIDMSDKAFFTVVSLYLNEYLPTNFSFARFHSQTSWFVLLAVYQYFTFSQILFPLICLYFKH